LIPVNRGILTTLYLAPEKPFSDAAEMNALNEKISACYAAAYGNEPFVRLLEGKNCPTPKMSSAPTSSKSPGGSIRARAGSS
jgi:N-acetyl-gamma-glutamylphosphate reductase